MERAFFETPADFRAWKGSGRPSITWPESVDEALGFGWINGVRRGIDAESHTTRHTPRRAGSVWSSVNVARLQAPIDEGRMRPTGLAAFRAWEEEDRSVIDSHEQGDVELPELYSGLLHENPMAWEFDQKQPPSDRKAVNRWAASAEERETRRERLDSLVVYSTRGERVPRFTWKKPSE